MEKALYYITHNLYTIRLLFSGMYDFQESIEKGLIINPQINNLPTPDLGDDKSNLKSDRVKVLRDYSKAYHKKKKESNLSLADCI